MNEKREMRRRFLEIRRSTNEKDCVERSIRIQEILLSCREYTESDTLFVYSHFGEEVRTDAVIEDALKKGKRVCLPFNDWNNRRFQPRLIRSLKEVDRSRKVPQPYASSQAVSPGEIDIIVMPGVVFDIFGNRIGMGGGFYDRFLASSAIEAPRIGLAYDFQLVDYRLPAEESDERLDMIITEDRVIRVPD